MSFAHPVHTTIDKTQTHNTDELQVRQLFREPSEESFGKTKGVVWLEEDLVAAISHLEQEVRGRRSEHVL